MAENYSSPEDAQALHDIWNEDPSAPPSAEELRRPSKFSSALQIIDGDHVGSSAAWLQIVQPNDDEVEWNEETQKNEGAGRLRFEMETLPESQLLLIPLDRESSREYRPGGFNTPLICYSTDLKKGIGSPGGDCLKCPHADFLNGKAPECQAQVTYQFHEPERDVILHYTFRRKAYSKAGIPLNKHVQKNPLKTFAVLFSTKQDFGGDGQEYWRPTLKSRPLPDGWEAPEDEL